MINMKFTWGGKKSSRRVSNHLFFLFRNVAWKQTGEVAMAEKGLPWKSVAVVWGWKYFSFKKKRKKNRARKKFKADTRTGTSYLQKKRKHRGCQTGKRHIGQKNGRHRHQMPQPQCCKPYKPLSAFQFIKPVSFCI